MKKILFIEDNIEIRTQLIQVAKSMNHKLLIYEASSQKEAEEVLEHHHIDMFFVDIQLEQSNGLNFAKELRKQKSYQFTPLVFITGEPTRAMEAFKAVHCYDYLLKPFTNEEIEALFKKLLLDYMDQQEEPKLVLNYKTHHQVIYLRDIVAVEYASRKIQLLTKDGIIEYKHVPLKQFVQELNEQFVQVHQSFVVHRRYIEKYDYPTSSLTMKFLDKMIPVGRSFKRLMEEVLSQLPTT